MSGQDQEIIVNLNFPFFQEAYKGHPPWDIGRPQQVFKNLVESGRIRGSVLDIGCGTGENAIMFALRGLEVWGVDFVPEAIRLAHARAEQLGARVTFVHADALHLDQLRRKFDAVIDSGMFHTLSDEERPRFIESLRQVLPVGGLYFMLVFSDAEPGTKGPRRISQQEIRDTFQLGWKVESIQPERFETTWNIAGAKAWFCIVVRTA